MGGTYLGVRQLRPLQRRHVAAEAELLDVELLEVLVPLRDLLLDRLLVLRVADDLQLKVSHLLHLDVLQGHEVFTIMYQCIKVSGTRTTVSHNLVLTYVKY